MNRLSSSGSGSGAKIWLLVGRNGLRWLWLESVFSGFSRDAGRAGGGISDVSLLFTCMGAIDG